jgi:non-specific serine/threonine protein kinase
LGAAFRFAGVRFDEAGQILTVNGQLVELERRPLELLALLLAHAGEVVTKDEILDALWPGREVTEASLTKCMARLRQAIGDDEHAMIRTIHGYGYRFAAPVLQEAARTPSAPALTQGLAEGEPIPGRPNWHLVRRLGSGGFGDAWLAEQTKSGEQRVFKFAADGAGLAALRREIMLGRLLRAGLGPRADLVRILDWHLDDLPAFVEIAFYENGNLAEWAHARGGAAALPLALRLELAAQVADALASIHSLAVLHKDLKPANVLIRMDGNGNPAIALTDFGSGRALDPSRLDELGITRADPGLTEQDSTAGTQMYRAPELAEGGAPTVLADLFALGVMLFQLAAGDLRRPLAPGWEDAIPDPLLREDIAAAAAGDPARRLADAAELARRLRSLPARRAERARADAEAAEAIRTRRALELARARRAPALALLVVLAIGLTATTLLFLRAGRAQRLAEQQAARARAVTSFLTDDIFSPANPLLAADPNASIKTVLAAAAADIGRRFPAGDPDRADIELAIGSAYAGLADSDHAVPLLRAALASLRARLGDADPQTLAVRMAMGELAGRVLDNDGMRNAGEAVLAAHPADPATELGARFLVTSAGCTDSASNEGCAASLRPLFQETRRRLGPLDPVTLKIESELAYQIGQTQHFDEAIQMARETVALTEKAVGPDHLLVQERRFILGEVLDEAHQPAEAAAIFADIRRRALAMSGTESELSARAATQLSSADMQLNRLDDAAAALQTALDYSIRARGELNGLSIVALSNLANIKAAMGRYDDAIALGTTALDRQRRAAGDNHPDSIWFENNLANFYHLAGKLPQAEAAYRDVLARARLTFTHGEWDVGHFEYHLGEVLGQEGKTDEARALLHASVEMLSAKLGADSPRTKRAQAALAALGKGK